MKTTEEIIDNLEGVVIEKEDFVNIYKQAVTPEQCEMIITHYEKVKSVNGYFDRKEQTGGDDLKIKDEAVMMDDIVYGLQNADSMFSEMYGDKGFLPRMFACFRNYAEEYGISPATNWTSLHFKIQKTQPRDGSGYHVWHYENSGIGHMNRVATWILYLNDVEEGGETEFLYYGKRIKPSTGDLVVWPAGYTHMHRGNPPFSDVKYIMTGWIELV